MISRHTRPSGALARVVADEDRSVVWSGEEVLPTETEGPRLLVSGPVSSEWSLLTTGHVLEALGELVVHMLDLDAQQRRGVKGLPPTGG
jgi:hypothetical protein